MMPEYDEAMEWLAVLEEIRSRNRMCPLYPAIREALQNEDLEPSKNARSKKCV